jgi:hypothetical protein
VCVRACVHIVCMEMPNSQGGWGWVCGIVVMDGPIGKWEITGLWFAEIEVSGTLVFMCITFS